jgi:hypothetical protein
MQMIVAGSRGGPHSRHHFRIISGLISGIIPVMKFSSFTAIRTTSQKQRCDVNKDVCI